MLVRWVCCAKASNFLFKSSALILPLCHATNLPETALMVWELAVALRLRSLRPPRQAKTGLVGDPGYAHSPQGGLTSFAPTALVLCRGYCVACPERSCSRARISVFVFHGSVISLRMRSHRWR